MVKKSLYLDTQILKLLSAIVICVLFFTACIPQIVRKEANSNLPPAFDVDTHNASTVARIDTVNTGSVQWRTFYSDTNLTVLIDSALKNNQELNIVMQEIVLAQNEVETRKGEYLPFVDLRAGAGFEKVGKYTRSGSVDENLEIKAGEPFPTPLTDFAISADVSWEVDVWKKLRNTTKSAALRYLSTIEGTNYVVTTIVAEIANSYYKLLALDNLLQALNANIDILQKALHIVEQQKQAAKVTELAVRKFEAEVLKNETKRYQIQQRITETENTINFLVGRFPQHVQRNSEQFLHISPDTVQAGIPSQLLANRPDVHQAQLQLNATDLDIDVATARFYPSLNIVGGAGFQSYQSQLLLTTPESMIYSLAGQLVLPIFNRKAIVAGYLSASARQVQAAYNYERTMLNAHIEVTNQLAKISNIENSFRLKQQQVSALVESVDISNNLFTSARADYMEVLLTQRDALEAKMELIETKVEQLQTVVKLYQALGGGWK